ncbi:hypothetical protein Ancab_008832 [Ancistrocladus abbreviatus]
MQQRRPNYGRLSGTDGSDFSYRMVVDSRYTKVAKGKSRLARLLLIQALVIISDAVLMLLPMVKGDAADIRTLSFMALCFVSLIIGELGRRSSKSGFLMFYMILSSIAMLLSVAFTINNNIVFQVFRGQTKLDSEIQKVQLLQTVLVSAGVFVQFFIVGTTVSLIHNMSPPKRSS